MKITFDIISDLHLDEWPDFNWNNQATSPFCIIAGDTARDRDVLVAGLEHIADQYQGVFVIDGNEEHRHTYHNLDESYKTLADTIDQIPHVTFLHNNIVILEGVAIVATCGWYSMNHDPRFPVDSVKEGLEKHYDISRAVTSEIEDRAMQDAKYLTQTVQRLQRYPDVKKIVIATHFLPYAKFIEHNEYIRESYALNASVNVYAPACFHDDTEQKISHWIYGHYHGESSSEHIGYTEFVTNPHGRRNSNWHQNPYFPKRITFD